MNEYLIYLGSGVGLTALDVTLLLFCPVAAALGTTVSAAIRFVTSKPTFQEAKELPVSEITKNGNSIPPGEELRYYNERLKAEFDALQRYHDKKELPRLVFIGLILGLVVALYFVGAITQSITSLARILALCILLGYQAPILWQLQERAITNATEKRLKDILGTKREP